MQLTIYKLYTNLEEYYGKTNWWPAEGIFEIIVGAVLTQNTNWLNVEKALNNLKNNRMLDYSKILDEREDSVKQMIRPAGFYNQKYSTLVRICRFVKEELEGDFSLLKNLKTSDLRDKLLNIKGIGKETADSILLYCGYHPVFVIDAYTKRIVNRLGISKESDYDKLQQIFENELPADVRLYAEYHGLIVEHAKTFCRKKPVCKECFLAYICKYEAEEKVG